MLCVRVCVLFLVWGWAWGVAQGIPRRLRDRFQREEDEQQRKLIERNEAHLYYNLRVSLASITTSG